jgi:hypothetical protein
MPRVFCSSQAAFVRFLRSRTTRDLLFCDALAVTAVAVHPMAIVWLALSLGGTLVFAVLAGSVRLNLRILAGLAIPAVLAGCLAWWIRSRRGADSFALGYGPLQALFTKQLLILSPEKGRYLADPFLLSHPLVVTSLVGAVLLALHLKNSLAAQFLVATTFLPVVLLFNPQTAPIVGSLITPNMIYRVLWMLPVALVLATLLDRLLIRTKAFLAGRRILVAHIPMGLIALLLLLGNASVLHDLITYSLASLKRRNLMFISEGELELLRAVGRDSSLAGGILAPFRLTLHIPVFTTRLHPFPSLAARRAGNDAVFEESHNFRQAVTIGDGELNLLRKLNVEYVVARRSTNLDRALGALPDSFRPLFLGSEYVLYAWTDRTARHPP